MTTTESNTQTRPFESELKELYGNFSGELISSVDNIINNSEKYSAQTITPEMAAYIFLEKNVHNRNVAAGKVRDYMQAINDGEWKLNHQGIAFYSSGILADGQHRMVACALSKHPIELTVALDFAESAIDTIDISKGRTAGDALQLKGIEDPNLKSTIAKDVMTYIFQVENGVKPRFSIPKIEKYVLEHDSDLTEAIRIGSASVQNVTEPCMNRNEASTAAYLLSCGNHESKNIQSFIAAMQTGVADYPEAPTIVLSKQFMKSKMSNNKMHKFNKQAKLALICKGINYWLEEKSVSTMKYSTKEALPAPYPVAA